MSRSARRPRLRLLGLLALAWTGVACGDPDPPRNAILIVLDTLRADRLSSYGYPVETSPVMDRLAAEGVLFETTVSHASWTLPAMVALMAGDTPTRTHYDGSLQRSLVETIRAAGWRTAAFVEGGFVSAQYGFDRGFDDFHDGSLAADSENGEGRGEYDEPSIVIEKTFSDAIDWLRGRHEQPFFLWIHTYEPHTPYRRPDYTGGLDSGALGDTFEILDAAKIRQQLLPFGPTERTWVRALYDGGVTACDRQIGRLLDALEELGRRDDTLIVVTSDHGEDIGGREPEWPGVHGHTLYDEQILVPLILHDPTREYDVKRVTAQVRSIDVLPSIIDVLGIPAVEGRHGRSLAPLMKGGPQEHRYAWSHVQASEEFGYDERFSLRTGTHKLVMTPRKRGNYFFELYDLESDPGERETIHTRDPARRARLQKLAHGLREAVRTEGAPEFHVKAQAREPGRGALQPLEPRVQERLRELGYVE